MIDYFAMKLQIHPTNVTHHHTNSKAPQIMLEKLYLECIQNERTKFLYQNRLGAMLNKQEIESETNV